MAKFFCGLLLTIFSLEIVSPVLTGIVSQGQNEDSANRSLTLTHELISHFIADESVDETRDRWLSQLILADFPILIFSDVWSVAWSVPSPIETHVHPLLNRFAFLQMFRI
jgi:hypothetical protein